jgi:hypothetical protein
MLASVLALMIGILFTFGVLAYASQYDTNNTVMAIWFITVLILASWYIADFLTPYISKILP